MTKKPKVTRKQKKADAMYKANPTWAAEDGYTSKMKTGGMVNSNAKVTAAKSASTKGVKSGVNTAVSAAKKAAGKVGGISTAPTKALPKAQLGAIIKTAKTAKNAIKAGKAARYAKATENLRRVEDWDAYNSSQRAKKALGYGTAGTVGAAAIGSTMVGNNAKSASKGMASKVASKANKQKMGGMMKRKSC